MITDRSQAEAKYQTGHKELRQLAPAYSLGARARCTSYTINSGGRNAVTQTDVFVFPSEKVNAHGAVGERPSAHGRSPTALWAIAHRPMGVDFL